MLFRMVDKHLNFHDLGRPGGKKPLRFSSSAHFLSFLRIDQKNNNEGGQTKFPELWRTLKSSEKFSTILGSSDIAYNFEFYLVGYFVENHFVE